MKYLSLLAIIFLLGLPVLAFAQDTTFVPLTTNAPFLEDLGNAEKLPDFLNNIYKLCIGAAAALAVLQIMRAGIMYMGGDSVTEKKEAKNLIAMSIGGLVLVLSPVIVFSIINPEILSLQIKGIEDLKVTPPAPPVVTDGTGGNPISSTTPGQPAAPLRGFYFQKKESEKEADVTGFLQLCRNRTVDASVKDVVAAYDDESLSARMSADGKKTIYSASCEAQSTIFVEFYSFNKQSKVSSEWMQAPGANKVRNAKFLQGCAADGGKANDWKLIRQSGACSAETLSALAADGFAVEEFNFYCNQQTLWCELE